MPALRVASHLVLTCALRDWYAAHVALQLQAGHAEYTPDNDDDDDDDYDGGGGGFEVYEHDGVGDIDYPNDDFDMAGPDESDRPDARFAGEDGGPLPMNLNVDGLMDTSLTSGPTSYEELCRHHIVRRAPCCRSVLSVPLFRPSPGLRVALPVGVGVGVRVSGRVHA